MVRDSLHESSGKCTPGSIAVQAAVPLNVLSRGNVWKQMIARAGGQLRMSRILMLAVADKKKDIVGILRNGSGVGTLDDAGLI